MKVSTEEAIKKMERSLKKFGDPNNTKKKTLARLKAKLEFEKKSRGEL